LILPWLLACAAPPPTLDVSGDPMLATLPSDVTIVGRVDLAAMRSGPFSALAADLDARMAETAGAEADRLALGCGDDGCAVLGEGRIGSGLDAPTGLGRLAARRLDEERFVVGDRSAIRRIAANARDGIEGLDPDTLAGRIPAGDAWVLLRNPAVLAEQAAARLERAPDPLWADVAADVSSAWDQHADDLSGVQSVALSVDGGSGEVRLRAVCDSPNDARDLRWAFEAWRALHPTHPASSADVTLSGGLLELSIASEHLP
jgi:hypothetical protein